MITKEKIKHFLRKLYSIRYSNVSSAKYWTSHNITFHYEFKNKEDSLHYMRWRFNHYPNYEKLMPCSGFDDKIILDYGCGPGHDIVGFIEYSKPRKIIAMDVSPTSLMETQKRVSLHNGLDKVEIKYLLN